MTLARTVDMTNPVPRTDKVEWLFLLAIVMQVTGGVASLQAAYDVAGTEEHVLGYAHMIMATSWLMLAVWHGLVMKDRRALRRARARE